MNLEFLIEIILYFVFAVGALLFLWDWIELIAIRFRLRHRLRALKAPKKELPKPLRYVEQLLTVSFIKESSRKFFIATEGLLFAISYVLSFQNYGPIYAMCIAFLFIAFPILLLAARLESNRSRASHEGISLVTELYRQYRINKLNMYEAINKTIESEGDYKLSLRNLYMLLIRLRSSSGHRENMLAINDFVFTYGTNWAKMLGQCIRMSIESGADVSAALADIAKQLKDANTLEEKRKMLNGEAMRMTLLLVPFIYIVCIIVAIFYLDLSPKTLIMNQFFNPSGFLLFLINIFLFLINLLVLSIVGSGKLDI